MMYIVILPIIIYFIIGIYFILKKDSFENIIIPSTLKRKVYRSLFWGSIPIYIPLYFFSNRRVISAIATLGLIISLLLTYIDVQETIKSAQRTELGKDKVLFSKYKSKQKIDFYLFSGGVSFFIILGIATILIG